MTAALETPVGASTDDAESVTGPGPRSLAAFALEARGEWQAHWRA